MMSATQPKRKAQELAVPAKGEDPAERKRVLNVLAQRRYRQKRRQHVRSLEERAARSTESHPTASEANANQPSIDHSGRKINVVGVELCTTPETAFQAEQSQLFEDPFAAFDADFVLPTDTDWNALPSLPNSPLSTTDPSDLSMTRWSPDSSIDQYTFPDEAHLEVLELKLLKGAVAIAQRLSIDQVIWSFAANSPFTDPSMALANFDHLPANLRPTPTQVSQPHSAVIDMLPWPTVRDKLILVFSLPEEMRPKAAASATGMIEFVYDFEDSSEGVRIWGDDPYTDQAWEVGEKVFKNWWWAFDRDVIRRSNELRRKRGATLLGRGEGSVLGEVT